MMDPVETAHLERRLADLEAGAKIYQAHVENLIERVFALEGVVEEWKPRLVAVERATPLKGPGKKPSQKPFKQPPKRPMR